MLPTKQKDLIAKTAELTNLPIETVTLIIKYYYKTVREKVSAMEYPTIMLEGIGNFYIKEKMLAIEIKKMNDILYYMEKKPDSARKERVIRSCQEALDKFNRVQKMIDDRRAKMRLQIEKKIEYKNAKQNNNNLEE